MLVDVGKLTAGAAVPDLPYGAEVLPWVEPMVLALARKCPASKGGCRPHPDELFADVFEARGAARDGCGVAPHAARRRSVHQLRRVVHR